MKKHERALLATGVATPVVYLANLVISSLTYPGYSHVRQYVSELGAAEARYPAIFNAGVILTGVCLVAAGAGFFLALRRLGGRVPAAALGGLSLALFGLGIMLAGWFPMPDPRHDGWGLPMAVHLAPAFLAWATRPLPELRSLRRFLVVTFVVMLALLAVMMGVGELVTRANVGVWQRTYALVTFSWIGIAAWQLARQTRPRMA